MEPEPNNVVAEGYDAVYEALPNGTTLQRLWREHALGADFPAGFEHISFANITELRWIAEQLHLAAGDTLVDLGCGAGGPGLWLAAEAGAKLVGVDLTAFAVQRAHERAARLGMQAQFSQGTFASTGLAQASADGAVSFDALQYAPDKRAALDEAARILRPGGRIAFTCFELEPGRVAGLPVLGDDPIDDYRPVLERAGFDVAAYQEAEAWRERLTATYQAVLDAREILVSEMGERAALALAGEIGLTLQLQPYRRRVLASAVRR